MYSKAAGKVTKTQEHWPELSSTITATDNKVRLLPRNAVNHEKVQLGDRTSMQNNFQPLEDWAKDCKGDKSYHQSNNNNTNVEWRNRHQSEATVNTLINTDYTKGRTQLSLNPRKYGNLETRAEPYSDNRDKSRNNQSQSTKGHDWNRNGWIDDENSH